ncbi:MAG: STAS domain-containing protein [Ignavibacteriaceae bacterium]
MVEEIDNVVVFTVNLRNATYLESNSIKSLFDNYFNSGFIDYIVDLSQCESIDSAFLSSLIIFLRTVVTKGGIIRFVKPKSGTGIVFFNNNSVRIFDLYETREGAIKSFRKGLRITLYTALDYKNENLVSNF